MANTLSRSALGRHGRAALDHVLYRRRTDAPPVVLSQNRVFVLPTRRGWAVLCTLLVMLVTSMNYALSLGYALTFLIAGLVGSSLIHVFRNVVRVQVEPSGSPRAYAGEPLFFSFRLTNLARYPRRNLRIWSGQSEAEVRELPPGGSASASVAVATRTRGTLGFGRFTVISDYPLGLWRAWAVLRFHFEGIVYPKPEAGAPALPASGGESLSAAARRLAELAQDQEVDGLRQYRPGDSLRTIAWKAVARGGPWYSKRLSGAAGQQWAELRWTDTAALADDERRLSRLAAWVLRAERNCTPFSLELPTLFLGSGQGAAHLDQALSSLGTYGGKRSEQ